MGVLGPDHYEVGVVLANRAALEAEFGDPEVGLDLYRRALALLTAALGSDHAEVHFVRRNMNLLLAHAALRL